MKISQKMTLMAILCASVSAPALGAWDNVGTINIDHRYGRHTKVFDMGGPVSKLRLRAEENDVRCAYVTATFGNRKVSTIFSGRLQEGKTRMIDLPGNKRHISRLVFNCQGMGRNDARIRILADVGPYRSDWMRGPNWKKTWAKIFNWGSNTVYNWKYLGEERFEGRRDRERAYLGWRGRGSEAIALKPVDANARCSRVTATFANGSKRVLGIHNGDYLRKGMYHMLDLPGERRNVTSLSMRCRATNARSVTIQIFTSK